MRGPSRLALLVLGILAASCRDSSEPSKGRDAPAYVAPTPEPVATIPPSPSKPAEATKSCPPKQGLLLCILASRPELGPTDGVIGSLPMDVTAVAVRRDRATRVLQLLDATIDLDKRREGGGTANGDPLPRLVAAAGEGARLSMIEPGMYSFSGPPGEYTVFLLQPGRGGTTAWVYVTESLPGDPVTTLRASWSRAGGLLLGGARSTPRPPPCNCTPGDPTCPCIP